MPIEFEIRGGVPQLNRRGIVNIVFEDNLSKEQFVQIIVVNFEAFEMTSKLRNLICALLEYFATEGMDCKAPHLRTMCTVTKEKGCSSGWSSSEQLPIDVLTIPNSKDRRRWQASPVRGLVHWKPLPQLKRRSLFRLLDKSLLTESNAKVGKSTAGIQESLPMA